MSRGAVTMPAARLPHTETTTAAVKATAPKGPNRTAPTSTRGRSDVPRSGNTATATAWITTYNPVTITMARIRARGMSRAGLRASPPGTTADSQPTKA